MAVIEKASGIVKRAFSLMNEANSQIVTYEDKVRSLCESWKDLYNEITSSDDDFIYKELLIQIASSDATGYPNNEKYIKLPDDCFKIRTLDYQSGMQWMPMQKFSLEQRTSLTSAPMYRLLGNQLWVIGGLSASWSGSIRLRYYPPADKITLPDDPLMYGTSYGPSGKNLITSPCYVRQITYSSGDKQVGSNIDWMLYVYNGTAIVSENIQADCVPITLYTGTSTISNVVCYKGVIYFLMGGIIYSATWDFGSTTLVPIVVGAQTGITSFTIQNNTIYAANATITNSMTLAGASVTQVLAFPASSYLILNSVVSYITAAGDLYLGSALLLSGITYSFSDGTYLYVVDTSKNLRRITLLLGAVSADDTLQTGVSYEGNVVDGRASILIPESLICEAFSIDVDYEWDYPYNAVYEIIAYQLAIDFARKRKDTDEIALLTPRQTELKTRFLSSVIRRDEYKHERISNFYSPKGYW